VDLVIEKADAFLNAVNLEEELNIEEAFCHPDIDHKIKPF
jgi:hypothetical protein